MICCCTGHRPKGFPWKYGIDKEKQTLYEKELYERLERYIIETGITEFISGMALGADMDYAAAVLLLREKYPYIRLHCAIPCRPFTTTSCGKPILPSSYRKVTRERVCSNVIGIW